VAWLNQNEGLARNRKLLQPYHPLMSRTWSSPFHAPLEGQFATLRPLDPQKDAESLHAISHGDPAREAVWRFLPYGPFETVEAMRAWLISDMSNRPDPLVWTVSPAGTVRLVGTVALLNIVPLHGRAEIGHVWFSPEVHKTKINTDCQYLILKQLFDAQNYRRVEWKCDSANHASRTTAARMGFSYEGRFRQHMYLRGRNRDTDWFAMTDKEWPRCKANFERWLYSGDKVSLAELNNG